MLFRSDAAIEAAFAAVAQVQAALSVFDPDSDLSRWHALPAGAALDVGPHTARVLRAAQALQEASGGLFDLAQGSGGWRLSGRRLWRTDPATRLDAGGIAKGHAVDMAVRAMQRAGCPAGWVNAGGDLRCFGGVELPIALRDEQHGGTRALGALRDGALASSCFAPGSRSRLAGLPAHLTRHVSVVAPHCLWADALTKVVAASGDAAHPVLTRLGAQAIVH